MLNYTDQQVEAAMNRDSRLLIRSLAGTGKTETVALRIEKLIEENVPASSILCLTFTNSAVAQLSKRLKQKGLDDVVVSTMDSYAYNIVNNWAKANGKEITITDGDSIINSLLTRFGVTPSKRNINSLGLMSTLRWLGRPMTAKISGLTVDEVDKLLEMYDAQKRKLKLVDFTDVLMMATKINETIAHHKFTEVIVDESQDSNIAHLKFVESLVGDRLVMVGDDNQAIYGFNGVDPFMFNSYCKDWSKLKLTESFRSNDTVLNVVNSLLDDDLKLNTSIDETGVCFYGENWSSLLEKFLCKDGIKAIIGRTRYDLQEIANFLELNGQIVGRSWESDNRTDFNVYCSTAHSSKGAEWDSVLIFNLSKYGFLGDTAENWEENRKLVYVAASRARRDIFLHSAIGLPYNDFGGVYCE